MEGLVQVIIDLTKLTKEEKEARDILYKEYVKIRMEAMSKYKEHVRPFQLAYQQADKEGWQMVVDAESAHRERILKLDFILEEKYKLPVKERK